MLRVPASGFQVCGVKVQGRAEAPFLQHDADAREARTRGSLPQGVGIKVNPTPPSPFWGLRLGFKERSTTNWRRGSMAAVQNHSRMKFCHLVMVGSTEAKTVMQGSAGL